MAIRAVLFDLDGTLWGEGGAQANSNFDWSEITAIQARALAPHFAAWGLSCDPSEVIPAFISDLGAFFRPASEDLSEPKWHPVVQQTLSRFGHALDDSQAGVFVDIIQDVPFHHFGVNPFPDAAPALAALAGSGLKLGAVTNNPREAARLAREARDMGLPDVLEVIVTSWDCGWRKPHHEPFRLALEALGVSAGETIFVGDTYANDIAPALELGMCAVLRRRPHGDVPAGAPAPHYAISELGELLQIVDEHGKQARLSPGAP